MPAGCFPSGTLLINIFAKLQNVDTERISRMFTDNVFHLFSYNISSSRTKCSHCKSDKNFSFYVSVQPLTAVIKLLTRVLV